MSPRLPLYSAPLLKLMHGGLHGVAAHSLLESLVRQDGRFVALAEGEPCAATAGLCAWCPPHALCTPAGLHGRCAGGWCLACGLPAPWAPACWLAGAEAGRGVGCMGPGTGWVHMGTVRAVQGVGLGSTPSCWHTSNQHVLKPTDHVLISGE
jgi:hypothetical protein